MNSMNLPKECNIKLSPSISSPTSPPPSYCSSVSIATSPSSPTGLLLEFSFLLNQKEEWLMSNCIERMMK